MQNNELDERRTDEDTLPEGVAQAISTDDRQATGSAPGTADMKQEQEGDVEMKDEEGGAEGPKVPLPWAFIDCDIDSLIELVGESLWLSDHSPSLVLVVELLIANMAC